MSRSQRCSTPSKKKFDGGKEEQEPAQIAFAAPDRWDSRYLLVDAAARFNLQSFKSGRTTMFVAPVIDYHGSNDEAANFDDQRRVVLALRVKLAPGS